MTSTGLVSILKGTYAGPTVFFSLMNDPRCDAIFGTSIYDCSGKLVRTFGKDDLDAFNSLVNIDTVLFSCTNQGGLVTESCIWELKPGHGKNVPEFSMI